MNILVVGDSWGYYFGEIQHKYWASAFDSSHWPKYDDHQIFNCSHYGGTNLQTLNEGRIFLLSKFKDIDLIIWFYTELGREELLPLYIPHYAKARFGTENVLDTLDRLHIEVNKAVSEIRDICPNAKWAIVGGHASLYRPDDYNWADFIIEDLLSEIVGYKLPTSHFQSFDYYNNPFKDKNLDILTSEMSKYENILSAKKALPNIFADGVHPNGNVMRHFAIDKILDYFSKNT
jgi:hypothetical protein